MFGLGKGPRGPLVEGIVVCWRGVAPTFAKHCTIVETSVSVISDSHPWHWARSAHATASGNPVGAAASPNTAKASSSQGASLANSRSQKNVCQC